MPSIDSLFGRIPCESNDTLTSSSRHKTQNDFISSQPPITYYANTKVFSRRSPRRHSQEVGKLYKKVFKDD